MASKIDYTNVAPEQLNLQIRGSMQLYKSLLCLTAFLVVVNSAPGFDFGVDALEGINDDSQGGCPSLLSENA